MGISFVVNKNGAGGVPLYLPLSPQAKQQKSPLIF